MDDYLTKLYFKRFQVSGKEEKLRNFHSEDEKLQIRNDQAISDVTEQGKMLDELIDAYVQKIKKER